MRVAAMNRIKRFEADASGCEALSQRSLLSLLGEKSLAFDPLCIVAGDVRLKTMLADQETGGVVHVSSVSTTPTTIHTPPK